MMVKKRGGRKNKEQPDEVIESVEPQESSEAAMSAAGGGSDRDGDVNKPAAPTQLDLKTILEGQNKIIQKLNQNHTELRNHIDREVKKVRDDLVLEISQLTRRMEVMETRQAAIVTKEPFEPDITVICANLPQAALDESDAQLRQLVEQLVNDGMGLPGIEIANVTRRSGRQQNPGLVELHSLDDKKTVLRSKTTLRDNAAYRNEYVRSAEGHTDRLIRLNFNTLLNHFNLTQQFRITGSGRLMPKEPRQNQQSRGGAPLNETTNNGNGS